MFDHVKIVSVEAIMHAIVQIHACGIVPPSFMRWLLPVNIMEAVLWDIRCNFTENAKAGWILARHLPGAETHDPATGAGPSAWSDGTRRREILVRMPCPRAWADLYTIWNLAFVCEHDAMPYVVTALLIPVVAFREEHPGAFLYRRCLALYAMFNYAYLGDGDPERQRITTLTWRDICLIRSWGRSNLAHARRYAEEVARCRAGAAGAAETGAIHV